MTDEMNAGAKPADHAQAQGSIGYGRGPVLAGAVLAALLIPVLLLGGFGAANAMTARHAARIAQIAEAPPTPNTGDESPGADHSATPPDRASDQIPVPPQPDTIYYIQRGDTLTALSAKFGQSIDSLANYNAVRNVNVISTGAVLRVPYIYVPTAPIK